VYWPGKVGWVATRQKDATPAEGELTGALMRSGEGMAVQRPMMPQGGPIDVAMFRGAPGHQQGEEKTLDVTAHREGQVCSGAAQLTAAPVNAQRSFASSELWNTLGVLLGLLKGMKGQWRGLSPEVAKMGENRGSWRRGLWESRREMAVGAQRIGHWGGGTL
jgi:hypothetical protein